MSFDDGCGDSLRSRDDDFRSKIAALLQEKSTGFNQVCSAVGVEPFAMQRALEEGTYGLPASLTLLNRFMSYFGLTADWLLHSRASIGNSPDAKRMRIRRLVWDFILAKDNFPWRHRNPFITYAVGLVEHQPQHTVRLAARPGLPRTILDVAYLYERLLKEGFFEISPPR